MSAGRRLWRTLAVPRADWLSFTQAGAPWIDFEWLTQALWFGVHAAAGAWGLWLVKAALLSGAGAVLWSTLGLYEFPARTRAPWLLAWSLAILPANDLRPENFSLLLFALEWRWLERQRLGPERPWSAAQLGASALFFGLWANLHGGFALGLAALALAAAFAPAERRGRLAATLAAAAAGTLLNPWGWRLWTVILGHGADAAKLAGVIREWKPPVLSDPWLAPFWLLMAAGAVVAVSAYPARLAPSLHGAATALLGVLAARHVRLAPYFAAVAAPSAAAVLGPGEGRWGRRVRAGAAAALSAFAAVRVVPELRGVPFVPRYAPEGIARFLSREAGALGGRKLFHPVEWGGFFGYRLAGAYPVMADGRYLFHPLLPQLAEARRSPEAFREFLDAQGVGVAVLKTDAQRVAVPVELHGGTRELVPRPMYLFFVPRADWALVYWDGDGMVFARRRAVAAPTRGVAADWLAAHEYRLWRPGDERAAGLMIQAGLADAATLGRERRRQEAEARP